MFWIVSALVAVVLVLLLMRRRDRSSSSAVQARQSLQRGGARTASARADQAEVILDKFNGWMLLPQQDACAAAMKMRGKTLPRDFVQQLPLPGCDREACDCRLNEVRGRRKGPRRTMADRRDDVRFKEDRRQGKDRRQDANAWNKGNI